MITAIAAFLGVNKSLLGMTTADRGLDVVTYVFDVG
jgi:hypothetical protein